MVDWREYPELIWCNRCLIKINNRMEYGKGGDLTHDWWAHPSDGSVWCVECWVAEGYMKYYGEKNE